MKWNYRLVRRGLWEGGHEGPLDDSYYYYSIHEAYYDDDGLCAFLTQDGIDVYGETVEECKRAYELMKEAFSLPILDYETRKELE